MAAYLNHALMADDTYDKLTKEDIFFTYVDKKLMTTFACGVDLASYDYLTHNTKTQEFLVNLIREVKKQKQIENPRIMAMLYGHICHYFLDTIIHPYIYYLEKTTKRVKGQFLSAHTLIEGYLSSYFINKRLASSILDIKIQDYFCFLPKECLNILDNVYLKVYNKKNIARNYQKLIMEILICETILEHIPFKKIELLKKIVKFREFLQNNNLTIREITNENQEVWVHPVTKEEYTTSALELYFKSIEKTIEAILETNKFLYENKSLNALRKVFPNISYDTGIDLSLKQDMVYFRELKK